MNYTISYKDKFGVYKSEVRFCKDKEALNTFHDEITKQGNKVTGIYD